VLPPSIKPPEEPEDVEPVLDDAPSLPLSPAELALQLIAAKLNKPPPKMEVHARTFMPSQRSRAARSGDVDLVEFGMARPLAHDAKR
jgi:hypothetical protein